MMTKKDYDKAAEIVCSFARGGAAETKHMWAKIQEEFEEMEGDE